MKYIRYDGYTIAVCPICKKEFLHNPQSIYKLSRGKGVKYYCSYTCWRKAGGDR